MVDGTASGGDDGIKVILRRGSGSEAQLRSPGLIATTVEVNGRDMNIEVAM